MVIASHFVGLTYPGMIELPGSFSGKEISPSPHLGPLHNNLVSLAIVLRLHAMTFRAPDISTRESCPARDSNLLGAETKGREVSLAICSAIATSYPLIVLSPVPTAVPPSTSL